jgi:peptide methionine sulfoxide reductase MsrA
VGTPTYTALANITLGSTASSVTFSSIPATYRDLVLVMNGNATTGGPFAFLRFNGDTGSNYNYVLMYGDGSSAASTSSANQTQGYIGNNDAAGLNTTIAQIMDYSGTDKHKSYLSRNGRGGGLVIATAGRWANTNAVTSMSVTTSTSTFTAGSTFALYGIAS